MDVNSPNHKQITLQSARGGILGVKAGMTQVYDQYGNIVAVTVIQLKPCVITQVKRYDQHGYQAVQVGFLTKKEKNCRKSEQGHTKNLGVSGFYCYKEIRLDDKDPLNDIEVGAVLSPEFIKEGDNVDLSAVNIGKGYQGGMKRYHMAGGYKTHGASLSHRQLGSIGNRADPGKCFKNKKMAGQMGHKRVTVQNVKVIQLDTAKQILLVNGSVPGPKSGIVTIRKTVKN